MNYKSAWLLRMGILMLTIQFSYTTSIAQCDFVNDISGLSQTNPPTGDAADPLLHTQQYVLVDINGNIAMLSNTTDFTGINAGLYKLYAVNYDVSEAVAVASILAIGQPWENVVAYKNAGNCLDHTTAYNPTGTCEIISVCEEATVCEFETVSRTTTSFETVNHTQNYCLVCAGTIEATSTTGSFDLSVIPAASAGADCQIYAMNYSTSSGTTVTVGDTWSTYSSLNCSGSGCLDFVGLDLTINPLSQTSGNGVATNQDFDDVSDGCAGAQPSANNGTAQIVTVDNTCVPAYGAAINARPSVNNDDLVQYFAGLQQGSRFPCAGNMDLTQAPIFFSVECDPAGPSTLNVLVENADPSITQIQAALYGPVNAVCPNFTTGSFVDCNEDNNPADATPLTLTTTGNPGDVFIVIVDTDGTGQFDINVPTLLNTQVIHFQGEMQNEDNYLTWNTEDAKDIVAFDLQRSSNGIDFQDIAQIGSTSSVDYTYIDTEVGNKSYYYRLKMLQDNGEEDYSQIIVLTRESIKDNYLRVYPNPTRDAVTLELEVKDGEISNSFTLMNSLGQIVLRQEQNLDMGIHKVELSLQKYPAGTYILSVEQNGSRQQRQLIKL